MPAKMGTSAPDRSGGAGGGSVPWADFYVLGQADPGHGPHGARGGGGAGGGGGVAAGKAGIAGQSHPVSGAGRLFRRQPLEEAEEHTRAQAEAAFLQGVEKLAEWGVLPEELDRTTLEFQGGSRVVYVQADGSLAASMLYLQGGTDHRDDLWMVVDEDTGLPVWIDCTLRSARDSLGTAEELGQAFCGGLGLETRQRGPAVWEVEGAGGLVYSASVEGRSGRISVEPLGFAWDLFGEEPASHAAEAK